MLTLASVSQAWKGLPVRQYQLMRMLEITAAQPHGQSSRSSSTVTGTRVTGVLAAQEVTVHLHLKGCIFALTQL